jgi:serine/threonine protein kinase
MAADPVMNAGVQSHADSPRWSPLPGVVIEAEIGRGGMGVVYRARQTFLDRLVALKLLAGERFADSDGSYAARFNREARILASLHHPNIAACHEAGVTTGGIPYLLMELVEGPSLGNWLAEHGRLPVPHALEMALDLAGALAHAQEQGICLLYTYDAADDM